jgi:hypothetical protein
MLYFETLACIWPIMASAPENKGSKLGFSGRAIIKVQFHAIYVEFL